MPFYCFLVIRLKNKHVKAKYEELLFVVIGFCLVLVLVLVHFQVYRRMGHISHARNTDLLESEHRRHFHAVARELSSISQKLFFGSLSFRAEQNNEIYTSAIFAMCELLGSENVIYPRKDVVNHNNVLLYVPDTLNILI